MGLHGQSREDYRSVVLAAQCSATILHGLFNKNIKTFNYQWNGPEKLETCSSANRRRSKGDALCHISQILARACFERSCIRYLIGQQPYRYDLTTHSATTQGFSEPSHSTVTP